MARVSMVTWGVGLAAILVIFFGIDDALEQLAIPQWSAVLYIIGALLGSYVDISVGSMNNVPGFRRRWVSDIGGVRVMVPEFLPPMSIKLTLNIGGAIVPTLAAGLMLWKFPEVAVYVLAAASVSSVLVHWASNVSEKGVILPIWLPALVGALSAWLLTPEQDYLLVAAFIAATLSVLVGGDLLNLRKIRYFRISRIDVGGAGTHDALFLSGVLAAVLVA